MGYSYRQPFIPNSSENQKYARDEYDTVSTRARHNETLTQLGNLYYTRIEDLENEKKSKYPDAKRIARLEQIIEQNKKYAQYATRNKKQR